MLLQGVKDFSAISRLKVNAEKVGVSLAMWSLLNAITLAMFCPGSFPSYLPWSAFNHYTSES